MIDEFMLWPQILSVEGTMPVLQAVRNITIFCRVDADVHSMYEWFSAPWSAQAVPIRTPLAYWPLDRCGHVHAYFVLVSQLYVLLCSNVTDVQVRAACAELR